MTTPSTGASGPRALPKEVRREQLIRATIKSIARHGLAGTTMATITREAGLSMGIANLHFKSKEKLLTATLELVANEYNHGQSRILHESGHENLTHKLQALIDFNLSTRVTQKNKLAVWFAFWGEAKTRPTYRKICTQSDLQAEDAICQLFEDVITEGSYTTADARLLATGYTALLDGLWLDLLITPRRSSRGLAKQVLTHYLASAFPKHLPGSS